MKFLFEQLLRSNFRCGRMLHSRTVCSSGGSDAPKCKAKRV